MSRYDYLLGDAPSTAEAWTPPPLASGRSRYSYLTNEEPSVSDDESLLAKAAHGLGAVVGAPKAGIDWLARQGAAAMGLPQKDTATTGQMLRAAVGLEQGDEGYAGRLGGRALEFATDVATDPLTYTGLGLGGKVGKVASAALAGQMGYGALQEGRQAYRTIQEEGWTPKAAEEILGTALSGTMAGLVGTHALRAEPTAPKAAEAPRAPETWAGEAPEGFRREVADNAINLTEPPPIRLTEAPPLEPLPRPSVAERPITETAPDVEQAAELMQSGRLKAEDQATLERRLAFYEGRGMRASADTVRGELSSRLPQEAPLPPVGASAERVPGPETAPFPSVESVPVPLAEAPMSYPETSAPAVEPTPPQPPVVATAPPVAEAPKTDLEVQLERSLAYRSQIQDQANALADLGWVPSQIKMLTPERVDEIIANREKPGYAPDKNRAMAQTHGGVLTSGTERTVPESPLAERQAQALADARESLAAEGVTEHPFFQTTRPVQTEPLSMERGTERRAGILPFSPERRLAERRAVVAGELGLSETHPAVERTALAEHEARTDALTGIGNKRAWEELQGTITPNDHTLVMDLKKFKPVNDTYGHDAGDAVLRVVGETLTEHLGPDVARFGGDEFGGVFRGLSLDEARVKGRQIQEALAQKTVRVRKPDGTEVDIPGIEAHIGVGKDAREADLAANAAAAESRAGGRGALPPDVGAEPGVARGPSGGGENRLGATAERGPLPEAEPVASGGVKYSAKSNAQGFYSQLARVVDDTKQAAASGQQWAAYLRDQKRGVKADEMKWTGLDDYLKERAGQKVTKAEIQDFLDQNEVQVREVTLGNETPGDRTERLRQIENRQMELDRLYQEAGGGLLPHERTAEQRARLRQLADEGEALGQEQQRIGAFHPDAPKFSQYQLPGGQNYREVLLTLPVERPARTSEPIRWQIRDGSGRGIGSGMGLTAEEAIANFRRSSPRAAVVDAVPMERGAGGGPEPTAAFRSGHFDEPNILAHLRLNDRTDADGKRVLFVEEVQSDWAQKGRKEGFRTDEASARREQEVLEADLEARYGTAWRPKATAEERAQWDALSSRIRGSEEGVPSAPFVTSTEGWTNLALKRVLRMAAEQGYDRVAWTTGEQQAARYDLSKQVKSIEWTGLDGDQRLVTIQPRDGNAIEFRVRPDGRVRGVGGDDTGNEFSGKHITDVVGKDIGDKIVAERHGELSGQGLRVGGEGMKGFYDQILPSAMNKLGKKWGAKVGETEIAAPTEKLKLENGGSGIVVVGEDGRIKAGPFGSRAEANARLKVLTSAQRTNVHSIDISPEMRASVMEGQPLFRATEGQTVPGVTTEMVRKAFAAGGVREAGEGAWDVKLPNDRYVRVRVKPEGIEYNAEAFEKGYSRPKAEAEKIVGAWQSMGKDGLIWLAKEADQGTIHHEAFHGAMDMALTPKEKAAVLAKYGNEEAAAEAYAKWEPAKATNSWFSKILAFFKRVYHSFSPSWESAFERTRSGEVYERLVPESERGTAYAVSPRRGQESFGNPTETIRREIEKGEYDYYGVRVLGRRRVRVGETLKPSREFVDDRPTGRMLDGTSVIYVKDPAEAVRLAKSYGDSGNAVVLVGSNHDMGRGVDPGERILGQPRVLAVLGHRYETFDTATTSESGGTKYATAPPAQPGQPAQSGVQAKPPATLGEKVREGWKAGLVSAPGTQLANALSNVAEAGMRPVEKAAAALVDRLMGGERTRFSGEAREQAKGGLSRLNEAAKELAIGLREAANSQGAIPGKAGGIVRIPFQLLSTVDKANAKIGEGAELRSQAYRQAKMELPNGSRADIEARQQQIMANPSDALKASVEKQVQERLFKKERDPDSMLGMLKNLRNKHPWLHIPLPFLETPGNIAALTIERSPLGFKKGIEAYRAYKKALGSGAPKDEIAALKGEAADALARPLVGTTIMALFGAYAKAGGMTGSGPTDPKQRNLLRETGWQPYSFRVGDSYIPFNRFEPISSLLGFAADMAEMKDQKKAGDIFDKAMGSIVQNLSSKTYLQGLADAAELINDPKRFAGQYLSNLASSAVPNIVAKAAQARDPYFRDTSSAEKGLFGGLERIGKSVEARIPGLSMTLPERRSATGAPVERPGNALTRLVSPIQPTSERPDRTLERALVEADFTPSQPAREIANPARRGEKIRLTDSEYRILQDANKMAADELRRYIGNGRFRAMSPEQQKKFMESVYDRARSRARERLFANRGFRQRAREASL